MYIKTYYQYRKIYYLVFLEKIAQDNQFPLILCLLSQKPMTYSLVFQTFTMFT